METAQILNEYTAYMFASLGRAFEIHSSAALHEKTLPWKDIESAMY
jgi:hypothetical protein